MKNFKILLMFLLCILMATAVISQEKQVSNGDAWWEDGIMKFRSDDGNFMTRFDVRMYINGAAFFEDKNDLSDGTHLRKARFAMKTKLWEVWKAEWDIDVAEGSVEVKDMYLSYVGLNNSHIKLGHFKMPLGLNELTSSRYQTFVERAASMLAFETDRRAGIEYSRWARNWNFRGSVYGQTMDINKNKTKDETGNGAAARLVVAPILNDKMTVHTGAAFVIQRPDDDNGVVVFKSESETKIGDVEILDTGNIFKVDNFSKIGLEGVVKYKNFSLQSEYIQTTVNRESGLEDLTFKGGYAFASWILTGEERPWDNTQGEFGQIKPKDNKKGAWELAFRYSHLDLSDKDVLGGMANLYTFGLNWYANPNIRFLTNYTFVNNSKNATGDGFTGNDDFSVLHFLAMIYF